MSPSARVRAMVDVPEGRALESGNRLVRTAPFTASLAVAFALYPIGTAAYGVEFALAVALAVAQIATMLLLPWARLPRVAQALPSLAFLATVALLRDSHGGLVSGYAPLVLVAVAWSALYGTRLELWASIAASALTIGLPLAVVGGPLYPDDGWRRTAVIVLVALIIGPTTRALVVSLRRSLRRQAEAERRLRELQAFELNDDVVQSLTVARIALDLDDAEGTRDALDRALSSAKKIIVALRSSGGGPPEPGAFVRDPAAADASASRQRD